MKRIIYIALALLLIGSPLAKGQAALLVLIFGDKAATENFHFSLKLGVNYSIIHGYDEGRNGVGLNFGLVNNIKLTDKLSLIPEFIPVAPRQIRDVPVLTTGNPELDDLLQDVESTGRKLNYIDIPVLLKVMLSDRFSISLGPQISFLTSAEDTYRSSAIEDVVLTTKVDITSDVNSVDFGAAIDLMYILVPPKGGKGINLFLRYNKGFLDIAKESGGTKYTTSMIQVGATFPFVSK
jgi:hypothetical protein